MKMNQNGIKKLKVFFIIIIIKMSCSDYKNLKEAYLDNTNMIVERYTTTQPPTTTTIPVFNFSGFGGLGSLNLAGTNMFDFSSLGDPSLLYEPQELVKYRKREKGYALKAVYLVSNTPVNYKKVIDKDCGTRNKNRIYRTDAEIIIEQPKDSAFRGFIINQDRLTNIDMRVFSGDNNVNSCHEYPIYDIQGEFYKPKNPNDVTREITNIYNKFNIYPDIIVDLKAVNASVKISKKEPIINENIIYRKIPSELYSFRVGDNW